MAVDAVADRYAQALFETAKAESRIEAARRELGDLGLLLRDHEPLRQILVNPDIPAAEKIGLLDRLLTGGWSELIQAFVRMVLDLGRADSLPAIVEAFEAAVDADQGRVHVLVRSTHPVPEALLKRLRATLERREARTVEIDTETDPSLIGGVQVVLGHRVIDGTVQRELVELRERLSAARVL